ncbi:hypothetical protein L7F22_035793 [Adiantum nelumboides]|nr:hypothetical protein [Adiantum nelumboides]
METNNEYRRSYSQDGTQSRSTVYQRSARPSFSRGSGSLCLSMDTSLEQGQRPSSGNDVAGRSRPSTMKPNGLDMNGIWRSSDLKPQAGEGVCTQSTLNAAGQPRKVVVPVGQMGPKDSSPLRRRNSSPQRYAGN